MLLEPTRHYLDPRTVAGSSRLHVPAMGIHEHMPPGFIHHGGPETGHPYLLMLFHNDATVVGPTGIGEPAAGHLIVWDINQVHRYGNVAQPWDHSWLHLSGTWTHRHLRHGGVVPLGSLLPVRRPEAIVNYLSLLYDELHDRVRQDADMIEGIVSLLWQHVVREVSSKGAATPVDPRLNSARRAIESSFASPFKLAAAAEVACLSPSYFCARFSRQFGVAPGEYVTRLRLRRAAQLLMNHEMAVFQVATAVGYDDPLYFSRLFRKRFGLSPKQYRLRYRA